LLQRLRCLALLRHRRARAGQPFELRDLLQNLVGDEATAHAKSLRVEETTGALRDLVGVGFRDFDRIRNDPDWSGMRELPQFQKTFDQLAGQNGAQ